MAGWLGTFILETWKVIYEASPFFLFGFLAAGALHYWVPARQIYRLLGQRKFFSIILASLAGIPLPLCSCSVLPTAIALRKRGASKGATVSFLISTPETGVESIALTYALIDLPMTIFRPLAALITALVAGLATEVFGASEEKTESKTNQDSVIQCSADLNEQKKPASFVAAFLEIFDDISYWLLLGIVLAGLIGSILPASFLENYLGSGIWAMLVMLAVGVPLYICASGSTPIVAALMMKGLSPGAALVFLLAGPATNIATLVVLWKFLGRRVTLIYLLSIVLVALLLGIYLDSFYQFRQIDPKITTAQPLDWIPEWMKLFSALAFLAILGYSLRRTKVPAELRHAVEFLNRVFMSFGLTPRRILYLAIALLICSYLLTGVLIVQPGENGIVKRFGRILPDRTNLEPGLHLHWPYPFETSEICDVEGVRMLNIGFRQQIDPEGIVVNAPIDASRYFRGPRRTLLMPMEVDEKEAYLLTGDENEIDIQASVEYTVSDPKRFLYGQENPEEIIRNHSISIILELIGKNKIDEVYTFLRSQIEREGTQRLKTLLEEQNTGIELLNLYLVNVHAPPEVHEYFRDLASSREDRERYIHDAKGMAAGKVYSASGEGTQKIQKAQGQHEELVLLSQGDCEAYLEILKQYELNPEALTTRLLYETYEQVLPDARLYLGIDQAQLGFWRWESQIPSSLKNANESENKPQRAPTLEEILGR